ncbi:bifunctional riboflavin kinase/FAD synthetase [Sandaracinobacter sp. RS1-74]|uniref:bifunctional riboflavin kinase/FAD synthetase n=1 Tax=Sandaracinobacteroides sayramensis TaxID=2913411 RepID=UPI001EDB451B|nr:bifunctional riboflavin kinase/FAD synthetase [Sandaracinobacteroides sayramensis]MCG2842519.1 bifunctional riboflavin kinase/FAD synthetase [Sandaracinobacteroides sayramensis]
MIVVEGEGGRVPAEMRGGAVALGNFDGVHGGHQAVIGAAIAAARAAGRPALVATFDPHPSRFFRPDTPPFALTSKAQKLALLNGLGVDAAIVIPFNAALAGLSAEAFAREWLSERLGVAHVVTGEDFTFGKGRSGSAATLRQLGQGLGFTAAALSPVTSDAEAISSTRIREALVAGDMAEAARLLTRPFAIRAPVVHGDKRGRTIGVPTANQLLGSYQRPRYGVYAVRVKLPDGGTARGVANLGVRPMFDPPKELLETWILDWSGDLYGAEIEVELVGWLRPEMQLDGLDALKAQIAMDAEAARALLG